jgi:type IV pilus assembly protein PilY1
MKQFNFNKILVLASSIICSTCAMASNKSNLSTAPLFLGENTKHNLMLAVDDSGSMDWELLMKPLDGVPTDNGVLYANNWHVYRAYHDFSGEKQWELLFVDGGSGFLNDNNSGYLKNSSIAQGFAEDGNEYRVFKGQRYSHLFNPGHDSSYNGKNVYGITDSGIVPPVDAYGFARSSDYNLAYYSPYETYVPWTSYKNKTYADSDPANARYDAALGTNVIDLTAADVTQQFRLLKNMVFKNDGSKENDYDVEVPITFYPATYYTRTYDASYNYLGSASASFVPSAAAPFVAESDTESFHVGNSIMLEAEDGTSANTPNFWTVKGDTAASGEKYITTESGGSTISAPVKGRNGTKRQMNGYKFTMSGDVNIWFRVKVDGIDSDSFFPTLGGAIGHDDFAPTTSAGLWSSVNNKNWYRMQGKASAFGQWVWIKWGTVDAGGVEKHIKIRQEETGVKIDQILITNELTASPEGLIVLGPEPKKPGNRSCNAGSIKQEHYQQFVNNPELFEDVDAIAPDGACLIKYEIKDGNVFPSGRSYADEIQNFANWFTYYRKRHQATRGAISASLDGVSGVNAGIFGINNLTAPTMYNWDDEDDRKTFLDKSYSMVDDGGTPLRKALNYAGEQYMRTSSPIISAKCQRNFTLLFTDGFNGGSVSGVGNQDGEAGSPYEDEESNTLADIALKYYNENLDPTYEKGKVKVPKECNNDTPPKDEDCNSNLHMNTYTAVLNGQGTIFNTIGKDADGEEFRYDSVSDLYEAPVTWPDVNPGDGEIYGAEQIDDLYHAALNGRGEIFNARKPSSLASTLSAAISDILSDIGQGSGITFNTSTLKEESLAYTAKFDSSKWSGKLIAQAVDVNTGDISKTEAFDAGEVLDNTTPNSRVILTYNKAEKKGKAFRWDNLSVSQKADLAMNPSGIPDLKGEERLNYLRGDRTKEGDAYRTRDSVLGDIIHSSPVFVGEPNLTWPDALPFGDPGDVDNDSNFYSNFRQRTSIKNRTPMVYAGANDGMIHGFKATETGTDKGKELLAFVPNSVYSADSRQGLHFLTDPDYEHRYYVDLKPVVADVYLKTDPAQTEEDWHTVLIGGLRGGGRGLFALDVTDPTLFTEDNADKLVMWEFTDEDDADLGDIVTAPKIAMMANGRWAAIFGNGYDDAGSGTAKLFILFLDGGLDGVWELDKDYFKIDTKVAGGLSAPALADAIGGDRVVDRIYAGDNKGNMWVFDVSGDTPGSWDVATKAMGKPLPLFSKPGVPITSAPVLGSNPNPNPVSESALPNVLVYFGSGQYLYDGDKTSIDQQYFVGVLDVGVGGKTLSDLKARTIHNRDGLRTISGAEIDWSEDYGFYLALPDSKERVVVSPQIRGTTVWFDTVIPTIEPCDSGGTGWIMAIDYASGLAPSSAAFDANGDGKVDGEDTVIVDENGNIVEDQKVLDLFDDSKNGIDSDGDGLADVYEIYMFGSIEAYDASVDSDRDGIPDYWEIYFGLDPNKKNGPNADADGDRISDLDEFLAKTDPTGNKTNPWYGYRRESYIGKKVETGMPTESSFLGDNLYTPTSSGNVERSNVENVNQGRVGRFAWTELVNDGS